METFNLKDLVRPNIWKLAPYSSARDEYSGHNANVFLDANENPYNKPFNRYPDPLQKELKAELAKVKRIHADHMFVGNGSDEAIDLVYRIFCNPKADNVVAIEPTYGMYRVCADINDVEYRPVLLDGNYQLNATKVLAETDIHTKVVWLCSPNNPTGNNLDRKEMEKILTAFNGIVVIDEAYSDFSSQRPFRYDLDQYPNLIVLNTLSKAWACAAIRLGMAFASTDIINLMNKVKYPYNVNLLTQQQAIKALSAKIEVEKWVSTLLQERTRMIKAFCDLPFCQKVYPTDANFFLAKMDDAQSVYEYLVGKGIIVRNRTRISLCQNCLRITIGSRTENQELMAALRNLQ